MIAGHAAVLRPFGVLLPGRRDPLWLCHAAPAGCAACRQRVALFLARELRHNLRTAIDRSELSYQAVLGAAATLEQARDLRRLTVAACAWDFPASGLFLADELADELLPAQTQAPASPTPMPFLTPSLPAACRSAGRFLLSLVLSKEIRR